MWQVGEKCWTIITESRTTVSCSSCVSLQFVTFDSLQTERSGKHLSKQELIKSAGSQLPVMFFKVPNELFMWTEWNLQLLKRPSLSKLSCLANFLLLKLLHHDQCTEKEQTNCSHIGFISLCLTVCEDGRLGRAGRQSAAAQHVAPLRTVVA